MGCQWAVPHFGFPLCQWEAPKHAGTGCILRPSPWHLVHWQYRMCFLLGLRTCAWQDQDMATTARNTGWLAVDQARSSKMHGVTNFLEGALQASWQRRPDGHPSQTAWRGLWPDAGDSAMFRGDRSIYCEWNLFDIFPWHFSLAWDSLPLLTQLKKKLNLALAGFISSFPSWSSCWIARTL